MNTKEEIWTEIIYDNNGNLVDYNGIYQISNFGRIKAIRNGKERIIKTRKNNWGYELVTISKNGIAKTYSVHRLVAWHFIKNDDRKHKTQVNHINEFDKYDNSVFNLEWVTPQQNVNHGTRNERAGQTNTDNNFNNGLVAKLIQHEDGTLELLEVKRAKEFVEEGFSYTGISASCRGKRKTHKGFVFRYYIYVPMEQVVA